MLLGLIVFMVIIGLCIKMSINQKQSQQKVSKYNPLSKGITISLRSGLPIPECTEMFLYDCPDRLILTNSKYEFILIKNNIKSCEHSIHTSSLLSDKITILYESEKGEYTIVIEGPKQLRSIQKQLNPNWNVTGQSIQL